MRALVQRVTSAEVRVDGTRIAAIGTGLVILLGVRNGDSEADAEYLAAKCLDLRIFEDAAGKLNLSARDVRASVLVVSQFTLYADTRKGRRPSFAAAAPADISAPLYEHFVARTRARGLEVATGQFGAHMLLVINNDGPVTLLVTSRGE